MKKLIVCLSLVAALALPAFAAEKSKPAEKACCSKEKSACSEKAKASCHGKSAVKQDAANLKGAQILKQ